MAQISQEIDRYVNLPHKLVNPIKRGNGSSHLSMQVPNHYPNGLGSPLGGSMQVQCALNQLMLDQCMLGRGMVHICSMVRHHNLAHKSQVAQHTSLMCVGSAHTDLLHVKQKEGCAMLASLKESAQHTSTQSANDVILMMSTHVSSRRQHP